MSQTDVQSQSGSDLFRNDSHGLDSPEFTMNREDISFDELNTRLNEINEVDQSPKHQTKPHRRSSTATRYSTSGLNLPSSIPPPVPESLPTTPGYELTQRMFENSLIPPNNKFPSQQRPTLEQHIGSTAAAPLLAEEKKIDENIMTLKNPPRNLYRFFATCTWTLAVGMTDGVLGALLPHIEEYYDISYAVVSLLWLGNAIGYVLVAFTAHHLDNHLGRQKMATLSCICFTIMYAVASSGTKYPVMVVAWFFGGIGGGTGLSQFNIFLSKLQNSSKYLGLFHGTYGFGAFIAPLIGTAMVDHGVEWHYFYLILLGIELFNIVFVTLAFKGCDEDLKRWDRVDTEDVQTPPVATDSPPRAHDDVELDYITSKNAKRAVDETTAKDSTVESEEKHDFKAAFKDYRSWLTCSFIFFYQGAEVSMGGWIVTFLLDYRGGSASSTGYVSSGYWAGITIGRLFMTSFLSTRYGVRRSIMVLSVFIMVFDLCAWLVPNTIGSAVFASLIGLGIGPIYPMMVSLLTRILPRKIRFCALVLGTAFGSSGGSAVPFAVGMVSEFAGTYVLHPIFLGCYAAMVASWIMMPNIERKGAHKNLWQKFW